MLSKVKNFGMICKNKISETHTDEDGLQTIELIMIIFVGVVLAALLYQFGKSKYEQVQQKSDAEIEKMQN